MTCWSYWVLWKSVSINNIFVKYSKKSWHSSLDIMHETRNIFFFRRWNSCQQSIGRRAVILVGPHLFIAIPLHSYSSDSKMFIRCTKFWRAATTLSGRMHRRTSILWNSDSFSGQGAGNVAVWGSALSKTAFHASWFFSKWLRIPWKEAYVSAMKLAATVWHQYQHPSRKSLTIPHLMTSPTPLTSWYLDPIMEVTTHSTLILCRCIHIYMVDCGWLHNSSQSVVTCQNGTVKPLIKHHQSVYAIAPWIGHLSELWSGLCTWTCIKGQREGSIQPSYLEFPTGKHKSKMMPKSLDRTM
jgi:hypothetical protein